MSGLADFFGVGTKAEIAAGVQEDAIAAQKATALAQLQSQENISTAEIAARYDPVLAAQRTKNIKYIVIGVVVLVVIYVWYKSKG